MSEAVRSVLGMVVRTPSPTLSAGDAHHPAPVVSTVRAMLAELGSLPAARSDHERVERIRAIDTLVAAAGAARAREVAEFCASQVAEQRAAGVPERRLGVGVAEQVALARGMSPAAGRRYVAFARRLVATLPETHAAMRRGQVSEWTASLVDRETAMVEPDLRRLIDHDLAPLLPGLSPRRAELAARKRVCALDPGAAARRARIARSERRVSLRPAPDTIAVLTGVLPVEQGVAVWAALTRHANAARARGDRRGRGQIMADTLVERVTGQASADAVPIEVNLTISPDTLAGRDETPAWVPGHGPVPASVARELVGRARAGGPAAASVRRLFVDTRHGTVVGQDPTRRRFTGALARLLRARDQTCSTPFCDAPIRHLDHITPIREGGRTTAANGRGVCESDNHVKEAPGWSVSATGGARHSTVTTTPTGHRYLAHAPPALGP